MMVNGLLFLREIADFQPSFEQGFKVGKELLQYVYCDILKFYTINDN